MRLIDADALIKELEKDEDKFDREAEECLRNPNDYTTNYFSAVMGRADGIRDAIIEIYDAPTIDAVNVVRCKECKWEQRCQKAVQHTTHELTSVTIGYKAIDFCSYGERKDQ